MGAVSGADRAGDPEVLFWSLGYDVASPRLWWLAGVALSAYGVAGRLVNQGLPVSGILCALFLVCGASIVDLPPPERPAALEAQVMAHSVPLVARWEGYRPEAYLDTIASPPIWTVCYGETEGVTPVRSARARNARPVCGLALSATGALLPYFEPGTLAMFLTPERGAAFNSLVECRRGRDRRSTAMRRLNAGDIRGPARPSPCGTAQEAG